MATKKRVDAKDTQITKLKLQLAESKELVKSLKNNLKLDIQSHKQDLIDALAVVDHTYEEGFEAGFAEAEQQATDLAAFLKKEAAAFDREWARNEKLIAQKEANIDAEKALKAAKIVATKAKKEAEKAAVKKAAELKKVAAKKAIELKEQAKKKSLAKKAAVAAKSAPAAKKPAPAPVAAPVAKAKKQPAPKVRSCMPAAMPTSFDDFSTPAPLPLDLESEVEV